MSKFFILVASLMCIFTLAACSGRATTPSDPTSICASVLLPFDDACSEARFDENRIQYCFTATNTGNEDCQTLAQTVPCINNPFETACETAPGFDRIDSIRQQRWINCRPLFPGIPAQTTGIPCNFVIQCGDNSNPFAAACLEFDVFDQNRATRIAVCTEGGGGVVAGCIDTNRVGDGTQTINQCIFTNPFHADCTHEAFNAARVARVAACSETSPDANLLCGSAIGADIGSVDGMQTIANCITEPFHADCQNLAFNTSRVNRLIACGDAGSTEDCVLATTGATSANWLRSFDGTANNPRLDTEPNDTNSRNQFLQGTEVIPVPLDDNDDPDPAGHEGGLNVGDVRTTSNVRPQVYSLNLAEALYGEIEEDGRTRRTLLLADEEGEPTGDASDGVAFFYGSIAGNANGYAGILAGTNLGTVPATTTPSATWNGQFRVIGNYFANKDFELEIDFGAESVEAFVQVKNDEDDPLHFLIKGTFNRNGVIDGTVELGDYTGNLRTATPLDNDDRGSGMLTGLIGEEGAVGVFIKNPTDTNTADNFNFAGGFVAAPTPDPEPTP